MQQKGGEQHSTQFQQHKITKIRPWQRQYSTINPALPTKYCKNWAHFKVWWLPQGAKVSRAVNLLLTYNRLFWTVLGTLCASTNTHSEKESNSECNRRLMTVQQVRNHSAVPKTCEGPSESCDNCHSLTQLRSAECFHPMWWSFSREARVQRLGQSVLP